MEEASPIVLTNGRIITMDDADSIAGAIAVVGDTIIAVGTPDEVSRCVGDDARVIELDERVVIPGLIDAHAHMEREGLKDIRLSLAGAHSISEVCDRIAKASRERPAGEWIVAMPVGTEPYYFDSTTALVEGRLPNRWELDHAAPENPVYIMAPFGTWSRVPTYASLNSRALELSGLLKGKQPKCGGLEAETDEAGALTGILVEHNERPTVEFDLLDMVPRFSWSERLEAVRRSMRAYNAAGTTSVYEGHGSYANSVALYQRLRESNELTVRVALTVSPSWESENEARRIMQDYLGFARGRGLGDEWLSMSGIYIGYGGNACVAELTKAALPDTGWTGFVEWCNDREHYEALVTLAAEHDLRVHTVILENLGEVLPIFEALAERFPISERRWVMEHVGFVSPGDIERIRRLGLIVTTIPVYQLWKNGDNYLSGTSDGNDVVVHRSLLEAGIPTAIGTDNIPVSLFKGMSVVRERRERVTGTVIGPEQRVTGGQALSLCTREAARLSFQENLKGSLEVGKLADLVVVSRDPTLAEAEDLESIPVEATMVGGCFVYENW